MDRFTDKDSNTDAAGDFLVPQDSLTDPNKRRFSRNALTGGAVLLSLANRSAWGATEVMGVMSLATLNSFNPVTRGFVSAPSGSAKLGINSGNKINNVELAAEIRRISPNPPYWGGTDNTYSTCRDTTTLDSVVLVKGECPPR